MLDAAREALSFVEGRTKEDLKSNRMLALSLVKELEIIGEAASKVAPDVKASMPGIPWPVVVGMRNRLIHAYFDVNFDVVWITTTSDLPDLIERQEQVLADVE